MIFHSILFKLTEISMNEETLEEPDFFHDLKLDQIIDAIMRGREEYKLPAGSPYSPAGPMAGYPGSLRPGA